MKHDKTCVAGLLCHCCPHHPIDSVHIVDIIVNIILDIFGYMLEHHLDTF